MSKVKSLLDVGFGQGLLLKAASRESNIEQVFGIESDEKSLEIAQALIDADKNNTNTNIELYKHQLGLDDSHIFMNLGAITLVEVIEHITDKNWVDNIFILKPQLLIVTTPNREFNALYSQSHLMPNGLRHPDHKFEFSRREFSEWANQVAGRHNYRSTLLPIGPSDALHGSAGQMAVFQRLS